MENSKDYFDKVTGRWDRMRESFFSASVRDKAMAAAAVLPGKLAADIGAGQTVPHIDRSFVGMHSNATVRRRLSPEKTGARRQCKEKRR